MLKETFAKIRTFVTLIKVWLQRTQGWMSIFNTGMILFLFLARLKDAEVITWDLEKSVVLVYIVGFTIMVIVGFLEDKLGFFSEEHKQANQRNLQLMEILDKINELEKEIKGTKDAK